MLDSLIHTEPCKITILCSASFEPRRVSHITQLFRSLDRPFVNTKFMYLLDLCSLTLQSSQYLAGMNDGRAIAAIGDGLTQPSLFASV